MSKTRTKTKIEDLQAMFAQEGIQFSRNAGWKELEEHVEVHKYHLSQELNINVTWEDAVFSWYDNMLRPVKKAITAWEFKNAFPRQPLGDLYLAVSDHWFYLKERDPNTTAEEAARSFAMHYGKGLARWFSRFLAPTNR